MDERTRMNYQKAFEAETGAYFRYTLYADRARKSGHHGVGELFDQIARNEWAHASVWYRQLNGEVTVEEALENAAGGEHYEWSEMYARWAEEARQAGDSRAQWLFEQVAKIESHHEAQYRGRLETLQKGEEFSASQLVKWVCANCGYVHEGTQAPEVCPVCDHAKSYFSRG